MIGMEPERGIGLDPPRRLVSIDFRELDVHQDEVWLMHSLPWYPLSPGHRFDHLDSRRS